MFVFYNMILTLGGEDIRVNSQITFLFGTLIAYFALLVNANIFGTIFNVY